MNSTHKTWAKLKPDTPFNSLFPDGEIPIVSILPITPREVGAPLCYLIPGSQLTDQQIEGLARLLHTQWSQEATIEQLEDYIRSDALPLKTDWFSGVWTTDIGVVLSMAELGEEIRSSSEENTDLDDYWDDSDLDHEDGF